jgi:hypothetical protein
MEQTTWVASSEGAGLHKPIDTLARSHSSDVGGKVAIDQCLSQQQGQEEHNLSAQAQLHQAAENVQIEQTQECSSESAVQGGAHLCSMGTAVEPAAAAPAIMPQPPKDACLAWIEAAKEGEVRELHHLLQQHPGLLNYQPPSGLRCSALHWTAARGHTDALRGLLLWGECSMEAATAGRCQMFLDMLESSYHCLALLCCCISCNHTCLLLPQRSING